MLFKFSRATKQKEKKKKRKTTFSPLAYTHSILLHHIATLEKNHNLLFREEEKACHLFKG